MVKALEEIVAETERMQEYYSTVVNVRNIATRLLQRKEVTAVIE
jgi:hypothetical protein